MRCGVGDYTAQLAAAIGRRADAEVAVLTSATSGPASSGDYRIFDVVRSWDLSETRAALKAVADWNPDIVHVQLPTRGYGGGRLPSLLPLLLRLLGRRVVETWHEYITPDNRRDLPNAVALQGLIVVRPGFREKLPPRFRRLIGNKPIQFIPNATSIPRQILSEADRVALRARYGREDRRMIAFFGFAFDHKRVELLFEIADPAHDHLVLICELDPADPYHRRLREQAARAPWSGRVTVTGFLPAVEVGRIIAAADAVVLPFETGGGFWNTSLQAALVQGTFVLTTSREELGYDPARNIHYSDPGDLAGMSMALKTYAGRQLPEAQAVHAATWDEIAQAHLDFYGRFLAAGRARADDTRRRTPGESALSCI